MADQKSLKTLTMVVYALQALGFINGITWIVAVIINYVKKEEVRGSWLESHFRWQIRTFWWGLLWGAIAGVLTFILVITVIGLIIAWLPLTILFFWYLYRVIRGWLILNDGKPAP
jgi:uncharacterized membrane protein